MRAEILEIRQGEGLMMIEAHGTVIERPCSITARGLMEIFLNKPFYVYTGNIMAKLVYLRSS